jgi:hypothetical protein
MIISARAKHYRDKAAECDLLASRARELIVKTSLAVIAAQWRELAKKVEQLEQEQAKLKLPK